MTVSLDVQAWRCCMQCVVRSGDAQLTVPNANTMMSITLKTCVTRSLMDMTV